MKEIEEQFNKVLKVADKFIPQIADLHAKMYKELMVRGFTADEAIKIVTATNYVGK